MRKAPTARATTAPAPVFPLLPSFGEELNAVVVGPSGAIGAALLHALVEDPAVRRVFAMGRGGVADSGAKVCPVRVDLEEPSSIAEAGALVRAEIGASVHLVVVATGLLHDGAGMQPEKSWQALDAARLERSFRVNAIGPALLARHLLPLLARDRKCAFAAISARVGSIEDNRLGGWYGYRASKAALNMLVRTLAIELARRNKAALCVALHPGTVDTALSRPFSARVRPERLFAPSFAAQRLLAVLDRLGPQDSGGLFAWDGSRIPF